jgi:hypothetical protein
MSLKSLRALGGGLILCAALSACAANKTVAKRESAHIAAPTPAERLALKHYKLGIDSYANDHYAEAISHWKITLEKDPQNPNAAEYIARAEKMLKAVSKDKSAKN